MREILSFHLTGGLRDFQCVSPFIRTHHADKRGVIVPTEATLVQKCFVSNYPD